MNVGFTAKPIPPGVINEDFDRLAEEFYKSIETVINESGVKPIELPVSEGVSFVLGYVKMRVEPKPNEEIGKSA